MEKNRLLFRFLEYTYQEDDDALKNPRFITGIEIEESYDRFLTMLKNMIGEIAMLKGEQYILDKITFNYNGNDEDLCSVDVYCYGNY